MLLLQFRTVKRGDFGTQGDFGIALNLLLKDKRVNIFLSYFQVTLKHDRINILQPNEDMRINSSEKK